MDFLQLSGKKVLVFGVANRKSVAWHIAKTLTEANVEVVYVVRSQRRADTLAKLAPEAEIHLCDVAEPEQIEALADALRAKGHQFDGLVHSIAFADYEGGMKPFHETSKQQFLKAVDVSCYSLLAIANAMSEMLNKEASVVAISISTTRMASENYGFMAPVKAALESSLAFLTKSFSRFSKVRFNAIGPGLLKTSASAGIPGYVDSYLFAEEVIPRGQAVTTQEAANVAAFLLSPRSSGITAQTIVVDAGMEINYFDNSVVERVTRDPS